MVLRDVEEANYVALERAVRNMLSSSRGKKPEDVLSNPDALADYIADAYIVVRALSPDDNLRFLEICEILSMKTGKSSAAAYIRTQFGGIRMIEA